MIDRAIRIVTATEVRPGDIVEHPITDVPVTVDRVGMSRDGVELVGYRDGWKSAVKMPVTLGATLTVLAPSEVLDRIEESILDVIVGSTTMVANRRLEVYADGLRAVDDGVEWMLSLRSKASGITARVGNFVKEVTPDPGP